MKKYLKQHKMLIIAFTFFVFASEGIILLLAILNGKLVDLATSTGTPAESGNAVDTVTGATSGSTALFYWFAVILILSVLMPICFYLYTLFIEFFRVKIQSSMRRDLFRDILKQPYKVYLQKEEGEYLAAYTTQIDSLDNSYFRAVFGILQIIASCVFSLIFLYLIYPPLAFYSVVGVIPAIVIPKLFEPIINKLQKEKIAMVSKNIATLNEYLAGLTTILLFHRQKMFRSFFEKQNEDIRRVSTKIPELMNLTTNLSHLLLQLYGVGIIVISSIEIANGRIGVGSYVAAIHILSDFTGGLGFTTHYLQQFSISKRTVRHILETASPIENALSVSESNISENAVETLAPPEKHPLSEVITSIQYKNVFFSYDGVKDMIRGFDRTFTEKGIYQVVGASGSGKSTLLNLLCGYIEPRSGEVAINGHRTTEIANLNDLFTIMRQEAIFFDGSLRDNITMFSDIPDTEILSMLDRLGLTKIREKLNHTDFQLSGGEERRIMLIRALLRNTPILILDEPLANLDRESVGAVEMLLTEIKDQFVFVITHEPLNIPVLDTITIL